MYEIWDHLSATEQALILARPYHQVSAPHAAQVREIIDQVRTRGESAVRYYSKKFDHCDLSGLSLRVSDEEIARAPALLSAHIRRALDSCMQAVRNFCAEMRIPPPQKISPGKGISILHRHHPIASVGLYVPRGRGSFPSMVYMQGIPAQVAEVPRVVMITPPEPDGSINPACLYAARESGVHEIYRSGGAQAIALLAFGTDAIAPVGKILGPGSRYVAMAKQMLSDRVDVGTQTGPSESMIIADAQADADLVTADLLIEAEHGSDSTAMLLSPSVALARAVCDRLPQNIADSPSPRREFLSEVFARRGRVIVTQDLDQAIAIANRFAPEHLQLHLANPEPWQDQIHQAGEILIGRFTPFSLANYATGANAVLPTGGFAKTASGLSIYDFLRSSSQVQVSAKGYAELQEPIRKLAEYEGFYHHAKALQHDRS